MSHFLFLRWFGNSLLKHLQNQISYQIWEAVTEKISFSQCRYERLQKSEKKLVERCKLFSSGPTNILPDCNYPFWFCPLESWMKPRTFHSLLCECLSESFLGKLFLTRSAHPQHWALGGLRAPGSSNRCLAHEAGGCLLQISLKNPNHNNYLPLLASTGFKLASI